VRVVKQADRDLDNFAPGSISYIRAERSQLGHDVGPHLSLLTSASSSLLTARHALPPRSAAAVDKPPIIRIDHARPAGVGGAELAADL
jgi:hypothetical protein